MPAILQPPIIFPTDIHFREFGVNWADLGVITANPIESGVYLGHGIALVGDSAGHIWRSADFGATWFDLGAVVLGNVLCFANLGNGTVICGDAAHRINLSVDYGFTWTAVTPLVPLNWFQSMAYLGDGIAIAGDAARQIYRSIDFGATWVNLGVVATNPIGAMAYLGNDIAIFGDNNGHIFRSVDDGATWADQGVVATGIISSMAYLGNGKVILGDFNGHIFRSVDFGVTWTDLGIIGGIPLSIALIVDGIAVFGDTNNHVFRSVDYGATWTDLGAITTNDITTIFYLDNGIAILGDLNRHIFRSVSAFERWYGGIIPSTYFCGYLNNVQAVASGVWTIVNLDAVEVDPRGWFNVGTHRWQPGYPGWYYLSCLSSLDNLNPAVQFTGYFFRSGGNYKRAFYITTGVLATHMMGGSCIAYFNGSTDYMQLRIYHNQGFPRNLTVGAAYNRLEGYLLEE